MFCGFARFTLLLSHTADHLKQDVGDSAHGILLQTAGPRPFPQRSGFCGVLKQTANRGGQLADIARRLTADDISAVAAWLATQVPGGTSKPALALSKPVDIACGSAILPAGRQTQ